MRILSATCKTVFVTIFVALLFACVHAPEKQGIIKGELDQRDYLAFELDNQMKVLVISDPETEKSAAALDVFLGNGSDPEGREGLAHFMEHMLFLGTEKYPQAGEYQEFIRTHGGSNNAYTSFDHTNYHFDIDPRYLEPALDRLAQFFIAPLFNPEFVSRERAIVESEYQSKLKSDGRRLWDARRQAFNPAHPLSRFAVGSERTLADRPDAAVRDDLIEFYNKKYSSNIMALVVLGAEPVDKLAAWVKEKFSSVVNNRQQPQRINQPLFEEGQLPAELWVVPERESRRLSLSFLVPPAQTYYFTKPLSYIGNILGHEGEGSLLAALKEKQWVDSLSAGSGLNHLNTATFDISMTLTESGMQHRDEIIGAFFQTIDLIKAAGINTDLFNEQSRLAEIDFRFRKTGEPGDYVRSLADRLQRFPANEVLSSAYLMKDFDAALIRNYLDELRPGNVLVIVVGKDLETDSTTKCFNTPFKLKKIDSERIASWTQIDSSVDVQLPEPNPFIPENLELLSGSTPGEVPVNLSSERGFELWYQLDTGFKAPRASIYFSVRSPIANRTPRDAVLTELYAGIVNEQLNAFSYPALLAGLNYELYRHMRGISVRVSGYNDKQKLLLDEILASLTRPIIEADRFALLRKDLIRRLKNEAKKTPNNQMFSQIQQQVMAGYWSPQARISEAQNLQVNDLERFSAMFREKLYVLALVHGNVSERQARAIGDALRNTLLDQAEVVEVSSPRLARLPVDYSLQMEHEVEHNDSSIVVYFQGPDRDLETRAVYYLFTQIVSSPFYHDLRTINQLGYVVGAYPMPLLRVPGIAFVVQSPTTGPAALYGHIEGFLNSYESELNQLSEADFTTHKESLIGNVLQSENSLSERSDYYWTELDFREYDFDSKEKLAAAIRRLEKSALIQFYRDHILAPGRRLIVYSQGSHVQDSVSTIPALSDIKPLIRGSLMREDNYFPAY